MSLKTHFRSLAKTLAYSAAHPIRSLKTLNHDRVMSTDSAPAPRMYYTNAYPKLPKGPSLVHVAALVDSNAGDVLLPIVLRDLFEHVANLNFDWRARHAHPLFDRHRITEANTASGVIIGGGGLFLKDTNSNGNSGWQWNCPIEHLQSITTPIVMFAVGYNRFRGQDDFEPIFRDHLKLLTQKSVYLGLRNSGSIEAIKSYLPDELHAKIRFQPCMTTLLSRLYPRLTAPQENKTFRIAFNAAFDRPTLRYPENEVATLSRLCNALKLACDGAELEVVLHCQNDDQILPFVRDTGVRFRTVSLIGASAETIVKYYARVDLAIGMRGHSQLIPFGCGTPIISIVSHDKLRWFLDDLNRPQWGVEVSSLAIEKELPDLVEEIRTNPQLYRDDINCLQSQLWDVSESNVHDAINAFKANS